VIEHELSPAEVALARDRRDFIVRNFAEQFRRRYRLTAGSRADRFLAGKEAGALAVAAAEKVFDSANRGNPKRKCSQ
jgi:hypothetical protein